jgi:hypothetical protein
MRSLTVHKRRYHLVIGSAGDVRKQWMSKREPRTQ